MARKKKWIQGVVKHPGAATAAAHKAGESVHEWAEEHKDSSNPTTRGRANLALRFQKGGDLHAGKHHKKPRHASETMRYL